MLFMRNVLVRTIKTVSGFCFPLPLYTESLLSRYIKSVMKEGKCAVWALCQLQIGLDALKKETFFAILHPSEFCVVMRSVG